MGPQSQPTKPYWRRGRRCSGTCCPPTSGARPPPATPSPSRTSPTTSSRSSSPYSTPATSAACRWSWRRDTCTRSWSPATSTTCRSCGGPARRGWRRAWIPLMCFGRWRSPSSAAAPSSRTAPWTPCWTTPTRWCSTPSTTTSPSGIIMPASASISRGRCWPTTRTRFLTTTTYKIASSVCSNMHM